MLGSSCSPCCDGWYCYPTDCRFDTWGFETLWACDTSPPNEISVQITFNGSRFCSWVGAGDSEADMNPPYLTTVTTEASTDFNRVATLRKKTQRIFYSFAPNGYYDTTCAFAEDGADFGTYPSPQFGLNGLIISATTFSQYGYPQPTTWDCLLRGSFYYKTYYSSNLIPYTNTPPPCSPSVSGSPSIVYGGFSGLRNTSMYNLIMDDTGPHQGPNPTLSGIKWTIVGGGLQPIGTVEVL